MIRDKNRHGYGKNGWIRSDCSLSVVSSVSRLAKTDCQLSVVSCQLLVDRTHRQGREDIVKEIQFQCNHRDLTTLCRHTDGAGEGRGLGIREQVFEELGYFRIAGQSPG